MFRSGKSTSIVRTFSSLLLKVWNDWDARGMVLFSLLLQIILSVMGKRKKYTHNLFTKTILWFAYLSADWVAIATLGKLSASSCEGSPTTNILRAFWAPLLILHLGGPDTITAYAYEDNQLWARHLLILAIKAILAVYVICLSWTPSWLSLLSLPLIVAGIARYVERILCLKLNSSQKAKPILSIIPFDYSTASNFFQTKKADVLQAYFLFLVMRPDVNDYLSLNLSTAQKRIQTYLTESTGTNITTVTEIQNFFECLQVDPFDVIAAELGFMFDVVYSKAALIYTKKGCFLRLTSFTCSFLVLLLFLISTIDAPKFNFSKVDFCITGILLGGAFALELYAGWVMLSSDWAILVVAFHNNVLVRKIFSIVLSCFPCLLHPRKRWSNQMGQFNLLEYCFQYKKKEVNKAFGILQKITDGIDLIEKLQKYMCTEFVEVPDYLKMLENYEVILASFFSSHSFEASRGEKALQAWGQYEQLKWSILQFDFDYSIIVWHLATSVCYYHADDDTHEDDGKEISKRVSNYMMYLLVMRPAFLLPEHSKSFWLDHTYDNLKELFLGANNMKEASTILLKRDDFSESTMESLEKDASRLASILNNSTDK